MRTINCPPYAPTLMESTRAIGYSLQAAIADIIDNSITAKATSISIKYFPLGQPYISILDDGLGMTGAELFNAMQYGSKNPSEERDSNDLGRFGLGLKTASLSQCRSLSVISIKNGEVSGRKWDIDHVLNTGEWSLIILEDDEIKKMPQFDELSNCGNGTLVVWQNLDRLSIGENDFAISFGLKMDVAREHIALIFHRFIIGEQGLKKLDILMNNIKIKAIDPFVIKKSIQLMDDELIIVRGQKVIVRPYILPHISKLTENEILELGGKDGLRRQQGFYVYRNKRLLVWGTWFRLMRQGELSKLARVQVDIPNSLDDLWTLDIKKSTAIPPEDVRKNLGNIIEKIALGSKRTWTFRGKKEMDDSKLHIWNRLKTGGDGIIYEINRGYPLIERIQETSIDIKKLLEHLLLQIEGNLPLNSLYLDLTNDVKLENDIKISEKNAIDLLIHLLSGCSNNKERVEMLERLRSVDPFTEFQEVINKQFKG